MNSYIGKNLYHYSQAIVLDNCMTAPAAVLQLLPAVVSHPRALQCMAATLKAELTLLLCLHQSVVTQVHILLLLMETVAAVEAAM